MSGPVTVHLGVSVFYDRQIFDNIRSPYGHEHDAEPGKPRTYFAALLGAVELTFRNMKTVTINISLVNSTLLNDDRALEVPVRGPFDDTIDGDKTMSNLHEEVSSKHPELYKEADVLLFVTTKYISTKFIVSDQKTMDLSFGVPKTGGVCQNGSNIGVVTDDGKTFKGVKDVAQQIAVLLGASLNSTCSKGEEYYPPSLFAWKSSTIKNCSEEEIHEFLSKRKETPQCWEDAPERVVISEKILPAVYNNITGYDICTAGTTGLWREVRQCKEGDGRPLHNRPCEVQCCEYNSRFARNGLAVYLPNRKVGDGETCENNKTCIDGKCEDVILNN